KVRTIRNGIETAAYGESAADRRAMRQELGIPGEATVIGTVGRLAEVKRYDLLIRSFARVKRECPSTRLLFAGDGPEAANLHRVAEESGVAECVHFAGYRTNVNEYLHAMDCFALTS